MENIDRFQHIEHQLEELNKHTIDWRFVITGLLPASLVIGGSLISLAIQVNTISERLNSFSAMISHYSTINSKELDRLSSRIDKLEQRKNERSK